MSLLDVYAAQAGPGGSPLVVPPSTPGERFSAELSAATAPDRWFNLNASRQDWYQRAIDELHADTGQTFDNPQGAMTPAEMLRLGNEPAVRKERLDKLITANRALREVKPDAINAEGIDTFIGVEGEAARDRARGLVGTGHGLAGFAGGALAPTPENILGLFIPPSRAVLGATQVGRGFLAGVGREAAFQAGAMAGLTAGTEALDAVARQATGTAPTLGESVGNIAIGAAAGGLLGGAFHALHAGPKALWERWNKLPEPVREAAPLEVRDAFKVLEQESLYQAGNRLGLPWAEHQRLERDAFGAVLRGQPFNPGEAGGDTPMTALGTILRAAPDQINVEGLQREAGRVATLSDSDLTPIVRELKPNSFKQVDAIDAKLRALDDRIEAIGREADQIGVPDVIDMDTAAILHDIEGRLAGKGLRKAEREQLLHERRQWIETLDVHGGLTDELTRMRREFFPEHGPSLREIAEERAKLMRQRELAQGEAQREVDFLRGKLDRLDVTKADEAALSLGFKEPADLARALQAAEFERQVRIAAEVPREGQTVSAAPREKAGSGETGIEALPAEQAKAIDTAAQAVMETPGTLGAHKAALTQELQAIDAELADARAALSCAGATGSPA